MESKAAALLVLVSALLAACIAGGEAQAARLTLIEFFDHLASDEYDQAADLYGGDYRQLIVFGPQIDPENRPELWRNACNFSGLQCLQVRSAALKRASGKHPDIHRGIQECRRQPVCARPVLDSLRQ